MGHTGTGMGTDFQTRTTPRPVTAVSWVFAVLQAHHEVRNSWEFFPIVIVGHCGAWQLQV